MKNRLIIIVSLLLGYGSLHAQFESPMKAYPTPQAAGFGIYGQVPVNGSTGVPDVSIPIYELKHKNISVPISLSYHSALVKPNVHPGWMGLGWNLIAGGCITRKVNCLPDELMTSNGLETGYFGHYGKLASDDWYSENKMNEYKALLNGRDVNEVIADEFYFNFCGYSGSFYLDHNGEWQVRSDADIKVVFDKTVDCINITDVRNPLKTKMNNYHAQGINSRVINSFTLITPDGTNYKFGGIEATEYSIPYFSQHMSYFVATSWFLSEIVAANQSSVKFTYKSGSPICDIKPFYTELKCGEYDWTGNTTRGSEFCRECLVMFPVYLEKIEMSADKYIKFESSARREVEIYPVLLDLSVKDIEWNNRNIYFLENELAAQRGVFVDGTQANAFSWMKLDRISITDGVTMKGFSFDYVYNNSGRIKLNKIYEGFDKKYILGYYKGTGEWLQEYFLDQDDHWGFFNGKKNLISENGYSRQLDINQYIYHREPASDINVRITELLANITYPTGGRVKFVYENNDYAKYIDSNNELKGYNSMTGGVRIKTITRFKPDGSPEGSTSYYYKNEFETLADTVASKPSSGILAKDPIYISSFDVTFNEDDTRKYTLFSSGALGPYVFNSNGSHIGYSNVIEVSKDGNGTILGYNKKSYTNFDTDIWGNDHYDEAPLYAIKFDNYRLSRLSSKNIERGKPLSEEYYTAAGELRKKVLYKYARTADKGFVRSIHFNGFFIRKDKVYKNVYFVEAHKNYLYSYRMCERQEYTYPKNSTSSLNKFSYLTYNDYNLLTQERHILAHGFSQTTSYSYSIPGFEDLEGANAELFNRHIFLPVVKKTVLDKGNGVTVLLSKELFTYGFQNDIPYLSNYQRSRKNESNLLEYYRCNQIDQRGNPLSVAMRGEPETVYLWSSDFLHPVAEIKNATYGQVQEALQGSSDHSVLRNKLPQAQVTLFEFSADGQRMWEESMRGLSTYYDYNSYGWLQGIYDHDDNIIKEYDYGFYKNN